MAAELAEDEGHRARTVVVDDDVASAAGKRAAVAQVPRWSWTGSAAPRPDRAPFSWPWPRRANESTPPHAASRLP
ncbi:hypothetical protein ABZ490_13420 [Streptomyces sp. NPDC005811]|uniref:hypothetical protein n=1 Tax=Streptomyces sp. NPDC005811 TaxID=3154565 RepID=UPI003408383E